MDEDETFKKVKEERGKLSEEEKSQLEEDLKTYNLDQTTLAGQRAILNWIDNHNREKEGFLENPFFKWFKGIFGIGTHHLDDSSDEDTDWDTVIESSLEDSDEGSVSPGAELPTCAEKCDKELLKKIQKVWKREESRLQKYREKLDNQLRLSRAEEDLYTIPTELLLLQREDEDVSIVHRRSIEDKKTLIEREQMTKKEMEEIVEEEYYESD